MPESGPEEKLVEYVRTFLPGITAVEENSVIHSLRGYPYWNDFFRQRASKDFLQGDIWHGATISEGETKREKLVKAMILSHSCDLDTDQNLPATRRVVFAPVISLDKYLNLLKEKGADSKEIKRTRDEIARQDISDILFLPWNEALGGESIVLLDNIHSCKLSAFPEPPKEWMAGLTLTGKYVFLLKFSVHFTRPVNDAYRLPASVSIRRALKELVHTIRTRLGF